MVDLVAFLEAAEDGDGVFDGGFSDHDGLEAAFEGGVFLDVFAVFIEGGGANGVEFAAGELGFEEVSGIGAAFGFSGTDDGVEFVDEEDDLAFGIGDFLEECLEAVLEFAAVFGACEHSAEVEGDDAFVFHRVRDIAGDDAACEAFDDGGFADAGFADEDGVVFGPAREDLEDATDFVVAADDGVDFSGACAGC